MARETEDSSTRNRLIEAAGRLFAEKGFRDTTVREICRLADANVAAVNYHFGDKEKLYAEVINFILDRMKAPLTDEILQGDSAPRDRLYEYVRTMLKRRFDSPPREWEGKFIIRQMMESSVPVKARAAGNIRRNYESMMKLVGEALDREVPLETRKMCAFSIIGQIIFYLRTHALHSPMPEEIRIRLTPEAIDRIARHITDFSFRGIDGFKEDAQKKRRKSAAAGAGNGPGKKRRAGNKLGGGAR